MYNQSHLWATIRLERSAIIAELLLLLGIILHPVSLPNLRHRRSEPNELRLYLSTFLILQPTQLQERPD